MVQSTSVQAVQSRFDMIRATVVTRSFTLEGYIYCPRLGKDERRLSNLLNSDRKFIAMTQVTIVNRLTNSLDPKVYPFTEVSVESIEFVQPYDDKEALREAQAASGTSQASSS